MKDPKEIEINEEGIAVPNETVPRTVPDKESKRRTRKAVNASGMGRKREGGGERTGRKKPKALKADDLASSSSRQKATRKASARKMVRKANKGRGRGRPG